MHFRFHLRSLFFTCTSSALLSSLTLAESPAGTFPADFQHQTLPHDNPDLELTQFAFGACWKNKRSQAHWPVIAANQPQFWLWLGDNIYADTHNMTVLKDKYMQLADTPGYRQLTRQTPVLATWDDHDYGQNDAGNDYSMRAESEQIFLDFFAEPINSPRRQRPGVYTSYYFGPKDKRVQLILLDTRYFRTPLKRIKGKPPYRRMGKWTPDHSENATMLGDAQWRWLKEELNKPARFRLIASSIQFVAPHNGYETWLNIPGEHQRMIDLIKKTRAEGVVFLSGDIHSSELCMEEPAGCYPLVDFTSSSLNVPLGAAPTHRRLGPAFGGANFGVVSIDWSHADPRITFQTKDTKNRVRIQHSIPLSRLSFKAENLESQVTTNAFAGEWQTFYGPMTLSQDKTNQWTLRCADRQAILTPQGDQLVGTWQGKKQSGQCTFRLSRDGQFLYGAYSYGDLPLQLDWAGWKASWEKHFLRDSYKPRQ